MLSEKWTTRIKHLQTPVLASIVGALIFSVPPILLSQVSSPLTVQPSTSRVGVNNTNPAYALDVAGTVNATSFRGDGSQLTNLPAASQWTTSGTSVYYNNGNVGVGTATPQHKVDVAGGDINTSGSYRVGAAQGVTVSSGLFRGGCGYSYISQITITGGIITGYVIADNECP